MYLYKTSNRNNASIFNFSIFSDRNLLSGAQYLEFQEFSNSSKKPKKIGTENRKFLGRTRIDKIDILSQCNSKKHNRKFSPNIYITYYFLDLL